jgi:tape measure domain-containing protein
MADIERTVKLIFQGESSDAQEKVTALSEKLGQLDKNAEQSSQKSEGLSDSIKKLASEAGLSEDQISKLDKGLIAINSSAFGASTGLQAAIIGIGSLAAALVGADLIAEPFNQFKNSIDNLRGSGETGAKELDFVFASAQRLGVNVTDLTEAYRKYLLQVEGSSIPLETSRQLFEGIVRVQKDIGNALTQAEATLKIFNRAVEDGVISTKELEQIYKKSPETVEFFARSLGLTKEQLFEVAKQGKLTTEEVRIFAEYLNKVDLKNTSYEELKESLTRLANLFKGVAVEISQDSGFQGAVRLAADGIKILVDLLANAVAGLKLLGDSFGNLFEFVRTVPKLGIETAYENLKNAQSKSQADAEALFERLTGKTGDYLKYVVREGENAAKSFADANVKGIGEAANAADKAGNAYGGLSKNVRDSAFELEKLASNERIKNAEFQVKVDVEKVKQETRQIEIAAKETIDRLKIKSNERISLAEFQVKIDIEKIKADTEQVKERFKLLTEEIRAEATKVSAAYSAIAQSTAAAFQALSSTIASTGSTASSVFSSLANIDIFKTPNVSALFELGNRIINQELSIQRDAANRQAVLTNAQIDSQILINRLTEEQIATAKIRNEQLSKGEGALIKVDGANLQPHLEAFMWEILRTIQIRVNQDGLPVLLGSERALISAS